MRDQPRGETSGAQRQWIDSAHVFRQLTASLAGALTEGDVVRAMLEHGVSALRARTGLMILAGRDGGLEIAGARGYPQGVADAGQRVSIDARLPSVEAFRSRAPQWLTDRGQAVRRFPDLENVYTLLGLEGSVALPLADPGGTAVGALAFHFDAPLRLGDDERELFETIASQCAQALDRARLFTAERTARAEAEAARLAAERARHEADEANQAKAYFLATMSHEIRTPINAIFGYAQLMELGVAGPVTPQQRDFLARLTATSEHLRALIDDVLDLSRIEAEQMTVVRRPALTGGLVAAALDLVRPQANTRGVRLVDCRPGEEGEAFLGDEHRVRQILANLLSNAVKFTEAGGTVTVDCGRVNESPPMAQLQGEGPWAFVRVHDTGIGIAPEEQARVFEPFHQVDRSHTRQQGGTGLGLAISRRLARLMEGDLTLESSLGVGSTFTLWLPAATETLEGLESAAERSARVRQTEPRAHGLAEVGRHLRARIEDVIAAYAMRLRVDPSFPQAANLQRSELEDHQLPFLGDLAQTLVVLEELGGPESDLLRDGTAIQRVISELHGAMRARRGWTEEQLEREYTIFHEEVMAVVRRLAPGGAGDLSLAIDVLDRLIGRARSLGLEALRRAQEPPRTEGAEDR